MVLKRPVLLVPILVMLLLGAAACSPELPPALDLSGLDEIRATPTPLPVPEPQRILSICLGEEPISLFIYGDQSSSAGIIRQAIYDSPVDRVNYNEVPVLLAEIPSLENGLVEVEAVEVFPGDRMVNAQGNSTFLASGVAFRPAGCAGEDCWEVYTGQPSVELDQVSILYSVPPGISWSDGIPITAEDSLFSYQAASLIYGSAGPPKLRYTASYQLEEENQLVWRGLPGYLGLFSYSDFFFQPLPRHQLENFTREEFLTAPQTNLQPLGWGPYVVEEWLQGDHLTLLPNPNYRGAEDGLPVFDALVFRFVESAEAALAAVRSGECQLAANQSDLINIQSQLLADQEAGELAIYAIEGRAWEQVSFGIDPLGTTQSPLQDSELRLALVGCVDRERISRSRLDAGLVVDDYLPPGDPDSERGPDPVPYQPAASGLTLKELGWIDEDGDPETPRLAQGVEGFRDGTPLQLTLLAADSQANSLTLEYIQEGFENCGVGLDVQTLPAAELLAAGPEGPVFGRNFDLAYFSWAAGSYQPCRLFLTDEIPGPYPRFTKAWGGVNAAGYSNQDFDLGCRTLSTNLPDAEITREAAREIRDIFQAEMPVMPLFFRRDLMIADPGLSGLESGYFSPLWNLEVLGR